MTLISPFALTPQPEAGDSPSVRCPVPLTAIRSVWKTSLSDNFDSAFNSPFHDRQDNSEWVLRSLSQLSGIINFTEQLATSQGQSALESERLVSVAKPFSYSCWFKGIRHLVSCSGCSCRPLGHALALEMLFGCLPRSLCYVRMLLMTVEDWEDQL